MRRTKVVEFRLIGRAQAENPREIRTCFPADQICCFCLWAPKDVGFRGWSVMHSVGGRESRSFNKNKFKIVKKMSERTNEQMSDCKEWTGTL